MNPKKEFIEIFNKNIHRDGADKLLEYLISKNSDFFDPEWYYITINEKGV